jgi:chaperonin cofactor prefoldin
MNAKIGMAILAVACVGLAVALVALKHQADAQQTSSAGTIADFSNQLVDAHDQINGLNQVNLMLTNALDASRRQSLAVSNQFVAKLVETSGTLAAAETSLQDAQQQITNLNTRVADLAAQNQALDQRAASLSNAIVSLNAQIATTRLALASSKTNNAFLAKQLEQQMAQRKQLEDKFNDLAEVRDQVHKLRMDLLVARRLDWMRQGIDPTKPMKGAQLLMRRSPPAAVASTAGSSPYNLNVEVGSDGSVRVIPPLTNAPATATPPSP